MRQQWSTAIKTYAGSQFIRACWVFRALLISCYWRQTMLTEEKKRFLYSLQMCKQHEALVWSLCGGCCCCETLTCCPRAAMTCCCIKLKSAQYAHNNEDYKVYFLTLGESCKTSEKWWSLLSSLKMREIIKQLLKNHFVLFVNGHIPSINYKRVDTALICRWNTLAKLQLIVCENKLPWCWEKLVFQGK